ncbi:probable sarcosine oxidase [Amborella trichopoda]|uniref:FAD dependent oxidoreductase domain-containing protein n=1 Tax=Amborella trichopoda TaxID=13333 RepID=W1PQY5_AMBTC|nr:probable sarcosine oxidase [Amborella trichopoda]ERN12452.1 hypothetical protein AMTR_s00025p00148550 [Amborella trichopoda]|eukprot:XP_006850871.1 probable sarcosine oxidase [Amborella trichopoda]
MEHQNRVFDVIVVGAGIMGSSAAYHLAKCSQNVLLLEQFDFLHQRGSSHGESRTLRLTYPEPYYPGMVHESLDLWEQAQLESGLRVFTETRHLDLGPVENRSLGAVIEVCRAKSMAHQLLDSKQVGELFQQVFDLPENWVGLVTKGGFIKPTKAVSMFQSLAMRRGAILKDNTEVLDIERESRGGGGGGGVRVISTKGMFTSKKCVVTVGAWASRLAKRVSGIELPIRPLHTTVGYWRVRPEFWPEFLPENGFPTFACYDKDYIYGTPMSEFPGLVKIALHGGYACDPDTRECTPDLASLEKVVGPWVRALFRDRVEAEKPALGQACMYSMTPDEDFVIDFFGGDFGKDVVLASGFSGHGFKMAPVVARVVTDLVLKGEAEGVELDYFKMRRFEDNPKGNPKVFEDQVSSYLESN